MATIGVVAEVVRADAELVLAGLGHRDESHAFAARCHLLVGAEVETDSGGRADWVAVACSACAPPVERYAAGMLTVGSIVIRVDDLERQKAFWTAALDYVPRGAGSDDFVVLRPRSGSGPNLSLDCHRSALQLPPRIHLDLYSDNQAAEVERLIALGASRVHWARQPPDSDYVIMADPERNRFCVIAPRTT
jgi:hypothetical protein